MSKKNSGKTIKTNKNKDVGEKLQKRMTVLEKKFHILETGVADKIEQLSQRNAALLRSVAEQSPKK